MERKNLFTGWRDPGLTAKGVDEAYAAGKALKKKNLIFDLMFTSDLIRAQLTGEIILKEMDQVKTETIKDKSLNERAYGDLTGMNKDEARAKFGNDQVHIWRRSYDISPPGGESLKDTHDRVIPFFKENIEPEISSKNILIAAHGNSLRALVKHLENISEQEIDNFLDTEEGEAMTQPEYRVIQALLATRRGEAADEIDAKENYVDAILANIQAGTAFEEAVAGIEPYAFSGGDLGWRKLGDIPSMFADVVPALSIGDVTKVRSSSGFHLVYLADAVGGERLVKQTDVRHILIKPNEVLDDAAAQRLAGDLVERIRGGEDFGSLARQYSDDIGSAAEGGELGWTNPGQMVPEFEAAMASATEGEVTEPFRSEFGWHILEVTGRRDKDFSGEIQRSQVANYIREQKYQEELDAWLREIREEAFVDIK